MKKIPSLYLRDFSVLGRPLTNTPNPLCDWVFRGEGRATEKIDGAACMVRAGVLFKRYDAKAGKTPPAGFEPCQPAPDPETGHHPGWLRCNPDNPADKWFLAAYRGMFIVTDGTYVAVGPHFQGNPYELKTDRLVKHGTQVFFDLRDFMPGLGQPAEPPVEFQALKAWLEVAPMEGIVWHHLDGRMAKIKRCDFDWPWPIKKVVVP